MIDLRSDTVTKPTPAMRRAIAEAPVGDDVYGEDPTVNALQARTASALGKAAGLFVPSGSMGNQASLHAFSHPGDTVLAGAGAHVLRFEGGAAAALSGLQVQTLGSDGFFDGADVHAAVTPSDAHYAAVRIVAVENTHNAGGGRVFPQDRVESVAAAARDHGLHLHLDGARLWNAAIATGKSPADLAAPFDSVTVCFSKGLGAPVGSVICGSEAVIERIHRARKRMGGGMRQAGVLAAAGLHALEHHVARLADDHANAQRLADGLEALGLPVSPRPETNIVMFGHDDPAGLSAALREREVWINPMGPDRLRAVTHLDVPTDAIDDALARIGEALGRQP